MAVKGYNFEIIGDIDKRTWAKVIVKAIAFIRQKTQRGFGLSGGKRKKFPPYSHNYAELKSKGFKGRVTLVDRNGKSHTFVMKNRPKELRGQSLNRQISPPNFRLTQRTISNLKQKSIKKRSAIMGWDSEAGSIVEEQSLKGRDIGGVSEKELDQLIEIIADAAERKMKKNRKNIRVMVG